MHVLTQYQSEDIAWLLTKTPHINVVPLVNEDMDENLAENIQETAAAEKDIICKTAATWSSYNSLCATGKRPQTTVNSLPLLAAPAHEWQTMVTVLKQAQKINVEVMGPERKTVITFDMALYEKARRLELLHPEFKDQFVFRIEEFHTVICTLRALGASIENSGIDDAWIAANIYGPTTTRQILEGKHMKRATHICLHCLSYSSCTRLLSLRKTLIF